MTKQLLTLYERGMSLKKIVKVLGIPRSNLTYHLKRNKVFEPEQERRRRNVLEHYEEHEDGLNASQIAKYWDVTEMTIRKDVVWLRIEHFFGLVPENCELWSFPPDWVIGNHRVKVNTRTVKKFLPEGCDRLKDVNIFDKTGSRVSSSKILLMIRTVSPLKLRQWAYETFTKIEQIKPTPN